MPGPIALNIQTNSYGTSSEKQPEVQVHNTRPCNLCRRGRIPNSDTRKACATCREKKRNYQQAKKRKALTLTTTNEPNTHNTPPVPAPDPLGAKRKADEVIRDEEGDEEMSRVLEKMKKRLEKQINDSGTSGSTPFPARVENLDPNYIEFQTATDMYKTLKSQSRSKALHFHGSFSIIAVSSVDNSKRERLVVQELRKIAKLSFEHDKPTLIGESVVAYRCSCTNHDQTQQPRPRSSLLKTIPAREPASQKHRQGDLAVWAGLGHKGAKPSSVICTGKILVNAEDDNSHPIGIKGQKITVKIQH